MTIPAGPKIDCHIHAIDPVRFPYADDTPYRPSGQEIAPAAQRASCRLCFPAEPRSTPYCGG